MTKGAVVKVTKRMGRRPVRMAVGGVREGVEGKLPSGVLGERKGEGVFWSGKWEGQFGTTRKFDIGEWEVDITIQKELTGSESPVWQRRGSQLGGCDDEAEEGEEEDGGDF